MNAKYTATLVVTGLALVASSGVRAGQPEGSWYVGAGRARDVDGRQSQRR